MTQISVVIPCYNCLPFLEACLRSVIEQTFANWEAIVVDDCSTDGDPEAIVSALADPRIQLVRHPANRGLAAARNSGFRAAGAPLVLPLDSDDLLAPTCLSDLAAEFDKDPLVDCVMCDFELFGAVSEKWTLGVKTPSVLTHHQWLPGAGVLMRRSVWENVGGYCEALELRAGNEDWDFWLSAAERGFCVVHVPKLLYRYRRHQTSMALTLHDTDHRTRKFIHHRHRVFFDRHGGGRKFVAGGFWRAATAAQKKRHTLTALLRALHAVMLDGRIRHFTRFVVATCALALRGIRAEAR